MGKIYGCLPDLIGKTSLLQLNNYGKAQGLSFRVMPTKIKLSPERNF